MVSVCFCPADCSKPSGAVDIWIGYLDYIHLPDLGWQQAERVSGDALLIRPDTAGRCGMIQVRLSDKRHKRILFQSSRWHPYANYVTSKLAFSVDNSTFCHVTCISQIVPCL